jgi:exopolyphosphatase / guanosine-5'-triphosphate,3'-diphosphate pyrophosphatase
MTIDQHIAAGIDLGSNTFRLLVAICSAGNLSVLDKKLVTVRLGRGLAENKILHERAMEKGFEVLRIFRKSLDHYQPQSIRVCGTEALRQAKNSHLFLQKAEEILQSKIDIVSGEEEAHLNLAGSLSGHKEPLSGTLLLVDVGGGSTELLFTDQATGQIRVESMSMGVIGLTEKFLAASQPDIAAMDTLLAGTIANALEKLKVPGNHPKINIIGCGGTATSMAALDLSLTSYNESLVHGHIMQRNGMEKLWGKLIVLPVDKRNALPCLGEGRGEILTAGIRIYQVLLRLLQQDKMKVSDTGLLEGILLSSISDISSLDNFPHNFMPKS